MDYEVWPPSPEWSGRICDNESAYARKRPPRIDWGLAAQLVAAGKSAGDLIAFDWWSPESRAWEVNMLGVRHNGLRVIQMIRSEPHGINEDGRRWYVGVLYPAPDGEDYDAVGLVGVVSKFGHLGCVAFPYGGGYRPLVSALEGKRNHLLVPVICGLKQGSEPTIMLPHYADLASEVASRSAIADLRRL